MFDTGGELLEVMRMAGVIPKNSADIVLDGKLHRFAVERDKGREKTGWVVGHSDGVPNAKYGDWRHGEEGLSWVGKPEHREDMPHVKIDPDTKKKKDEQRADGQRQATERARELWERAESADPSHGYLQKKNIPPFGLRQANAALLVPYRDIKTNEITTIQRIFCNSEKGFFEGTTTAGACYTLGADIKSGAALLCEGAGTAHSLHEMTGYTTVAAGSCHAVKSLAKLIAAKYRGRKVIVCADRDSHGKGEEAARAACKEGGFAGYILPSFADDEQGSDFNDFAAVRGLDEAEGELQKQIEEVLNKKSPLEKFIKPIDGREGSTPIHKIAGLFPRKDFSVFFGQSGCGKSFLLQRIFTDLANGGQILDGFHYEEKPLKCLIFVGESGRGMYARRANMFQWQASDNLQIIATVETQEDFDVCTTEGQKNICEVLDVVKPDICAFDSLSAFLGADESDADMMKLVCKFFNIEAINRDIAVVLVHHTRKRKNSERKLELDQSEASGSSILNRWAFGMIGISAEKDEITSEKKYSVTPLKTREGKDFIPFGFEIQHDERGYTMPINLAIETRQKSQRAALWQAINEHFSSGQWFNRGDVEEFATCSKTYITECLRGWTEKKKILQRGNLKSTEYSLPFSLDRLEADMSK